MSDGGRQNWLWYAARCAILVAAALAFPIVGHSKGRIITPTTTGSIASCGTNPVCTPGQFGYSIATNAGTSSVAAGSVVVIGAPDTTYSGASNTGVAFVFVEPSGGWGATLPSPTILETAAENNSPTKNTQIGYSVAISSDGTVIVVGAPGDNGTNGAAWVFTSSSWTPGSLTEDHELTASDGASGDQFGASVAISPSGNTIVVGAPDHSAGVGEAYVFKTSGELWNTTSTSTILPPGSTTANEYFGTSVAISGDASATSSAIFVGAPGGTASTSAGTSCASASGVVDVFEGSSSGWSTTASIIPDPANASNDQFGATVAIAGTTAVVGAPNTLGAAAVQNAGAAYVFTGPVVSNTTCSATPVVTLTASGPTSNSYLGASVAISGDGSVIVAGAPGAPPASSGFYSQGTMYQFDEPARGPSLLGWSSENESDTFESSKSSLSSQDNIGASAAVEISGRNTLVYAGAPGTGTVSTDPGTAYVFQGK